MASSGVGGPADSAAAMDPFAPLPDHAFGADSAGRAEGAESANEAAAPPRTGADSPSSSSSSPRDEDEDAVPTNGTWLAFAASLGEPHVAVRGGGRVNGEDDDDADDSDHAYAALDAVHASAGSDEEEEDDEPRRAPRTAPDVTELADAALRRMEAEYAATVRATRAPAVATAQPRGTAAAAPRPSLETPDWDHVIVGLEQRLDALEHAFELQAIRARDASTAATRARLAPLEADAVKRAMREMRLQPPPWLLGELR